MITLYKIVAQPNKPYLPTETPDYTFSGARAAYLRRAYELAYGKHWNVTIETKRFEGRQLSATELADLPNTWLNTQVDDTTYYTSSLTAIEISETDYDELLEHGYTVQAANGKFYAF